MSKYLKIKGQKVKIDMVCILLNLFFVIYEQDSSYDYNDENKCTNVVMLNESFYAPSERLIE